MHSHLNAIWQQPEYYTSKVSALPGYFMHRLPFFYPAENLFFIFLYFLCAQQYVVRNIAWHYQHAKQRTKPPPVWPYPRPQRYAHGMRPVADPNGTMVVSGVNYKMQRFKLEDRVVYI